MISSFIIFMSILALIVALNCDCFTSKLMGDDSIFNVLFHTNIGDPTLDVINN